jgi:hypothetical protein
VPPTADTRPAAGWLRDARLVGFALALVLALRILYLLRFGWDPNWMGFTLLGQARSLALGTGGFEEAPLAPALLVAARMAGLSGAGALGAVYLIGHVVFVLGALGLASFVWPDATQRRRYAFALSVALLPLLAAVWGHGNVAPLLGAALAVSALALAGALATRARASVSLWVATALVGALAAGSRYEGLACTLGAALVLAALGRSMDGVRRPWGAAAALAAGAAAALAGTWALRAGAGATASPNYGFYTFYDGLPFLMWPDVPEQIDEYGRYVASMGYFGSFAENEGSVLRALLANPGAAVVRFLAKIPDLAGSLVWVESLSPVGALLAVVGLRRLRTTDAPRGRTRAWILLAYAGPLAILFVPAPSPPYFLAIVFPLLVAVARGVDRLAAPLSPRAATALAATAVAAGAALIGLWGRTDFASTPVFAEAAAFLEQRCRQGCLANYLPQGITTQAWVDLEAGAPLPVRDGRSEAFVLGRDPPEFRRGFRYHERVRRARAAGWRGPVLYVRFEIATVPAVHPVFHRGPQYEGPIDLSHAVVERRFERGRDRVTVYLLPDA